ERARIRQGLAQELDALGRQLHLLDDNSSDVAARSRQTRDIALRHRIEVDGEERNRQRSGRSLRRAQARLAHRKKDVNFARRQLAIRRPVSLYIGGLDVLKVEVAPILVTGARPFCLETPCTAARRGTARRHSRPAASSASLLRAPRAATRPPRRRAPK